MLNVKTITTGLIATSLLTVAVPASASTGAIVETRIEAAQLQTAQGIVSVYEYLESVAIDACAPNGAARLADQRKAENCAANLLEEFVESIDDQNLTEFYFSRKDV